MRITVFGAAGAVGTRVVQEALSRGHVVTAAGRTTTRLENLPPQVQVRRGDASDPDQVAGLARGQDLVISTTRPAPGAEHELTTTAKALIAVSPTRRSASW